jgi:hypothetical protein
MVIALSPQQRQFVRLQVETFYIRLSQLEILPIQRCSIGSSSAGESGLFSLTGSRKVDRANIDNHAERQFKEAAHHVLQFTPKQLEALVKSGDFVEVRYEQEISK